jgi:hypothetical protein
MQPHEEAKGTNTFRVETEGWPRMKMTIAEDREDFNYPLDFGRLMGDTGGAQGNAQDPYELAGKDSHTRRLKNS